MTNGAMTKWDMARRWLRFIYLQRVKGFPAPTSPHFDEPSKQRFLAEIGLSDSYLEFGSGGSTVIAAQLRIPTISVESDWFYARLVSKALPKDHKVNLISINIGLTWEWGLPVFRPRSYRGFARWLRYVDAPFGRLTTFPNFILVDGRFRAACALESARQANLWGATATLMLDDYLQRREYHMIEAHLGAPEMAGRAAYFRIGHQLVSRQAVISMAKDPM